MVLRYKGLNNLMKNLPNKTKQQYEHRIIAIDRLTRMAKGYKNLKRVGTISEGYKIFK